MEKHEHFFTVVHLNWEDPSLPVVLRVCQTCGMTHKLDLLYSPVRWVWKQVLEVETVNSEGIENKGD